MSPDRTRRLLVLSLPAAWLALFLLVPALLVLRISVATPADSVPPYTPLFHRGAYGLPIPAIHLDSYAYLFGEKLYLAAAAGSLRNAALTTALCLLLGYPMAAAIARARRGLRTLLLLAVVLPFWTSFTIRIYALIGLLKGDGVINRVLLALHIVRAPLAILDSATAVAIGMAYAYLPFAVLPLYAVLEKHDPALVEAASDLGAGPASAFFRITLPLSMPGVLAAALLVFVPALGEYVVPELLGGGGTPTLATQLWNEFFANQDWPTASAVTVVLMLAVLGPLLLVERAGRRVLERR